MKKRPTVGVGKTAGRVSRKRGQPSALSRRARDALARTRAALGARSYEHVTFDEVEEFEKPGSVGDDPAQ